MFHFYVFLIILLSFSVTILDDGKLQAEGDFGEFWVIFGGFAPTGKKVASEDNTIPEETPSKLYWYISHYVFSIYVYVCG
ncbi:putative villin/Gelsolin [Helianthus anomalus]